MARKRKAASLAVPTDDKRVRLELRSRGEPITLFGERPEDRRERLRELLYREQESGAGEDTAMLDANEQPVHEDDEEEGEFYTQGSDTLVESRKEIARYSLPRAKRRIAHQRLESTIPVQTHVKHRKAIKERLGGFELFGSQIASERPMGIVRFAPNGQLVACGDWAGSIKLLDVPNLETRAVLRGHKQLIGGISWYPGATLPQSGISDEAVNLASSGGEGEIHLWALNQDTPIATLSGHSARVCRTDFHPSGKYLASASYDTTWRLWDIATTTELLLQEGHSKEVYTVTFNEDGSLVASAGLDSIGRIWDLRTGRTVMLLEGHIKPIHAADWGSDSIRVMTGSQDGFAKCWDLRAVRETASIGAHRGGVTDLRWFKGTDGPLSDRSPRVESKDVTITNGEEHGGSDEVEAVPTPKRAGTFFVSSGFDKTVNIFSADDWALCKSLTGHDGVVVATDITADARWIASCGRDRTVKLWARDDMEGI
ncbi:hypothetical protein BAUCODRAFT_95433 [Baudoinia panamericana UAMH 10762]|uniref:Pre-mRNA processing factor 4 (PRP4)-like domain-containing protein n=1 Tax=Baudoinia panamericana (strain UAMH 10762) TaxID=717646 RepID=M2N3K7_BAUPA|nr:uncharacterized protein BAUCODRAFT_95433 [Baudoinia panamericana UAMH 10762]EMC93584.1 hypothetical protein BAUCODRAFT_95433 [Baudoinia panamericana UAMH 10762]